MASTGPESRTPNGTSADVDRGKWEEEMKAVLQENERQMKGQLRDII